MGSFGIGVLAGRAVAVMGPTVAAARASESLGFELLAAGVGLFWGWSACKPLEDGVPQETLLGYLTIGNHGQ